MRTDRFFRAVTLLVVSAFVVLSCAQRPPTAPDRTLAAAGGSLALRARVPGLAPAQELQGTIGPGAAYFISVPESWNGDLVLYIHGFTAPVFPVGLPPGDETTAVGDLRAIALDAGFAFAYSNFSETGLNLKDAVLRTEQLAAIFDSRVGRAQRTYLAGSSLGALAGLMLIEAHPERYAGMLSLCGMLGGVRAELNYLANVRVVFDALFGADVLPGNLYELPPDLDLDRDIIGPAAAAMAQHPDLAYAMTQIEQTPIPFQTPDQIGPSIIQALVIHALELGDILERTHGQGFFDNMETVYTGNLPPELLASINANVERYDDGAAAKRFLTRYYEPSGNLDIHLVSMYDEWDPVVPSFHEDRYRALVEAHGDLANLEQVKISRYAHVKFTREELADAFHRMVGSDSGRLAERSGR